MTNIHGNKTARGYKVKITCFDESTNQEVPIGYAQSFEIKIPQAIDYVDGLGFDRATEIIEGIVHPSGTIEEVFINTNLIDKAQRNDDGELPYLNFLGVMKIGGVEKTLKVSGAKISDLNLKFGVAEKVLKGSFPFKALDAEVI
jgi:hypothetical protein